MLTRWVETIYRAYDNFLVSKKMSTKASPDRIELPRVPLYYFVSSVFFFFFFFDNSDCKTTGIIAKVYLIVALTTSMGGFHF